jgi:hypothetical protein
MLIFLIVASIGMGVFLHCKYPAWNPKDKKQHPKWFYAWIIGVAVLGGTWAFFLPIALNSGFSKDDDGAALRQALIYTTGGILGVITLGETHRKNTLEKDKNDQDHTRQVHAERRSRYTTAIEQLSKGDSATTRLGGVYSLVGLVDEWLADEKTIPSPSIKERRKEGQVIINNLCAYIRSPFPLAERAEQLDEDYTKDLQNDFDGDKEKFDANVQEKAALEEERQVRQTIIEEISERLRGIGTSGPWSQFNYDFSNAHFFYSTNFIGSHFNALLKFSGATFKENADFSMATFASNVNLFLGTTFRKNANFREATFEGKAHFLWTTFREDANFRKATFRKDANFKGSINNNLYLTTDANFIGATFKEDANFSQTTFHIKPIFESTLDKPYKARFSNKAKLKSDNFQVSHSSPYKIDTDDHRSPDGTITTIPEGCIVFDPKTDKEVPHTPAPNSSF